MNETSQFQGLLIGALGVMIPLFITCFAFLKQFATKSEVAEIETRANQHAKEAKESIEKVEQRLSKDIADNRDANAHQFGSISSKLDGLQGTVQIFANETSRCVGMLEGKLTIMEQKERTKYADQ